jgi:DNA-binding MarR family transcriptional regulator
VSRDDAEGVVSDNAKRSIEGEANDPAAVAMDGLRRIVRSLRTTGVRSQRDQRVSAAQLFVLREIRAQPGLSMTQLAQRTVTSQSTVSEVVSKLVGAGLVTRVTAPGDHRRAELALTAVGEELLGNSPETVQERLVAGFRALPPGQQRQVAAGLEAWLVAAGLADVPATMFFEPVTGERHHEQDRNSPT